MDTAKVIGIVAGTAIVTATAVAVVFFGMRFLRTRFPNGGTVPPPA